MPLKCGITHEVLEVLELWGLLVPVLLPAVVGAGVVPGAACELVAGELATGTEPPDWETEGAEAADDEPAAAQPEVPVPTGKWA